jgi:DNA-binding CsgD family transcriptional regulator
MAFTESLGCADRDAELGRRAVAAFLNANYAEVIKLVDLASPNAELHLLRLRALYRDQRYADALSALEQPFGATADQRLLAAALRAANACELGDLEGGRAALEGLVCDAGGASIEVRSEIAYHAAFASWEAWDLKRAEELIAAAPVVEGVAAAKFAQLSGWTELRRGRYQLAVTHFLHSLVELENAGVAQDLRFRAKGVHAVAVIASETINFGLWKQLEKFCDDTQWTNGVRCEHFWTVTCRRFIALLRGDLDEAWMRSREAVFLAPSDAMRAIAETNAATMSRLVGDQFAARHQFEAAWDLIKLNLAEWKNADVEHRIALTNFAIEAADVMEAEARKCITLYQTLEEKPDHKLALSGDPRLKAFEEMAAGRICETMGEKDDAVRHYELSLNTWKKMDYRTRAALVARSLHRLTGDAQYLDVIHDVLRRAPNAWFGDGFIAQPARLPELERLSKAERNVLRELLSGKSSRDIAQALGRSPFTINNHTKRLFDAFGVRSRAALIARAAERGLSPDQVA